MFRKSKSFTLSQLQELDPFRFEVIVGDFFKAQGYQVEVTRKSGDEGVDLYIRRKRELAIVQCKRFQGTVGQPIIRDLYGTMVHTRSNKAYLVTTGKFSAQARSWAAGKPIELIDGRSLEKLISYKKAKPVHPKQAFSSAPSGVPPLDYAQANITYTKQTSLPSPSHFRENKEVNQVIQWLFVTVVLLIIITGFQKLTSSPSPTATSAENAASVSTRNDLSVAASENSTATTEVRSLTSQVESSIRQELLTVEGINTITTTRVVQSATGYTIFLNAVAEDNQIDLSLATSTLKTIEDALGEPPLQLVLFVEDTQQSVNYVWTSVSQRWTVTKRPKDASS